MVSQNSSYTRCMGICIMNSLWPERHTQSITTDTASITYVIHTNQNCMPTHLTDLLSAASRDHNRYDGQQIEQRNIAALLSTNTIMPPRPNCSVEVGSSRTIAVAFRAASMRPGELTSGLMLQPPSLGLNVLKIRLD